MISHKTHSLFTLLVCLLLSGCLAKPPAPHKTWVDLAEISENVTQTKKDIASHQLDEDEKQKKTDAEKGPKARDLSAEGGDVANPYLKGVSGDKKIPSGEGIEGEGVMLNFDNADIYEVIQVIAETLELSYIIDPQVKGTVNIRSGQKIPKSELFVIFKKLLNINGLDIRDEGDHYYIFVAAKPSSLTIFNKDEADQLKPSSKVVTQVVPVMHISSGEAQKLVEPYLSQQAVVYNLADQNTLVLTDFEGQIIDALSILSRLDVSSLSSMRIKVIRVEQAPLFDLRDELKEVLTALKINKKDYEGVQLVALERVNSIMLIGYSEELVETAIKWVEELDKAPTSGRDNIFIYSVRNSVASELVDLVGSLISDGKSPTGGSSKTKSSKKSTTPTTPGSIRPPGTTAENQPEKSVTPTAPKSSTASGTSASMQFAGEPSLIADDARNIILIRALFPDYQRVVKLLERLDNMPTQVLIEVLVAEVLLTDELQYGVEWAFKNNGDIHGIKGTLDTDGLNVNVLFDNPTDLFNLVDVLATNNGLKVVSSPQVLVLNNESATVNVGQQVPIVTSQFVDSTGGTTPVSPSLGSNQTVQYKDTGVILNVTPRINAEGIILLEIDQQVSNVAEQKAGGINSPTINTKQVKTKLAVKDGQSILMGGLISSADTDNNSGVPLLKDIPGLGWLFKNQANKGVKQELLLMVTPYVIENEDVLDQYIKGFKEKVDGLRQDLAQ